MRGRISITIILAFILLSSAVYAQGWRTVSTGTSEKVNDVHVPAPGLITIVTDQGNAMHSVDGGTTWHHNQLLPGESINALGGFNDPLNSTMPTFATGDDGSFWRSTDGGQNWNRSDFMTSNDVLDITVSPVNDDPMTTDVWASGENGTVLHSTNGGLMWQQQSVPYQGENLNSISFGNDNNGIIGGSDWILYNTTNGGQGWTYRTSPVDGVNFNGSSMPSSTHGWTVGGNGTILNTTDGGSGWSQQSSGTSQTLTDVAFLDENNGIVTGHGGTLLTTTNAGATWAPVETGYTGDFQSAKTDNDGNYWVTGAEGALLTNAPESQQSASFTLDKDQLNFGVTTVNDPPVITVPGAQRVYVNSVNEPTDWQVQHGLDWLHVNPTSGTGTGFFDVTVDATGLGVDEYQGQVTVSDTDEGTETFTVTLSVQDGTLTQKPFGSFDTPLDQSTVRSSVPVTGWALDDVGVESVKIYRDGSNGQVYIGDAQFVEGARPDVQTSYPDYPNNHSAGWGYMMLTNFLPNNGNGTFTLHAIATDVEGKQYPLGSKTITCDNANAVKPFGAIDSPQPGGTASGSNYLNWGWALTPQPNKIPTDGSTIDVHVDGVSLGNPVFNRYRSDIAAMFPCYANHRGAGVQYTFDTSEYTNGVHTIQWTARDDAGNSDGIGSRFFTIQNSGGRYIAEDDLGGGTPFIILNSAGPIVSTDVTKLTFGAPLGGGYFAGAKFDIATNTMNAGTPHTQTLKIENTGGSPLNWEASTEQNWISFDPATGTAPDWLAVIVNPAGLDAGTHTGYVTISDVNEGCPPLNVKVVFNVYAQTESPFGGFNFPDMSRVVSGTINITGWALDDVGVETLQVYRQDGDDMVLIGDANFVRGSRPDIAQAYGIYPFNNYAGWSLSFATNILADGDYYFEAVAADYEGNETTIEGYNFTIDNANEVTPFGDIDTPAPGEIISGDSYAVTGWTLTPMPNTIPTDGSTINVIIDGVNAGSPVYNTTRDDIAALFPGYNNSAGPGGTFYLNTTAYEDGVHSISWSVQDDQGNTNESIGSREFVIQNNSNITVDVDDDVIEIPKTTELLNAYPNPFNPTTNIAFNLSTNENVSIIVFDILGRQVTTLLNNEFKSAGSYKVYWNGKTESGHRLSSGIYLVMMKAGNYMQSQKIMLLK